MTVGELMEWRYLRAELEKEQVTIITLYIGDYMLTNDADLNTRREISPSNKATTIQLLKGIGSHIRLNLRCLITSLTSLLPI